MSHFIQDNQVVIKTADEKIILLIKGGDNNVSSARTNKRCTSWYLQGVFPNENEYMAFVEVILLSDISGGSWQFQSLKNKSFKGFREYENTIINRFERALKSALYLDWKISDVKTENVAMFKRDIEYLIEKNNFSLNDEDGFPIGIKYFLVSYDKEVTPEQRAIENLKERNYSQKDSDFQNGKYIEFCKKYSDGKLEELINDVHFCASFAKFNLRWSGPISMLLRSVINYQSSNEMDFACFNIITNQNEHNVKLVLDIYDSDIELLLSKYPRQMETLSKLDSFKNRCLVLIDKAKSDKYDNGRYTKNYNAIVSADYKMYKEQIDIKINENLSKAKDEFIKNWNDLIASCWYKNTNERLPRIVGYIDKSFATNTFTLKEVREDCEDKFHEILKHYKHQHKKNQPVIKKMFKELIFKYTLLFEENSLDAICEYFGFQKPINKIEIASQINEEPKKCVQLSLFDFAA